MPERRQGANALMLEGINIAGLIAAIVITPSGRLCGRPRSVVNGVSGCTRRRNRNDSTRSRRAPMLCFGRSSGTKGRST